MYFDKNNLIWCEWLFDMCDGVLWVFCEFLWMLMLMVIGFLLFVLGLYVFDYVDFVWIDLLWEVFKKCLFVDFSIISDFLGVIVVGIISVILIIIFLLLLVVQQGVSLMISVVLDQFLWCMCNQVYFGYFIGLVLYCLVVFFMVYEDLNVVFSVMVGFVLILIVFYLLIMLLYFMVYQMCFIVIVSVIVDCIVVVCDQQCFLLYWMCCWLQLVDYFVIIDVYVDCSGYLVCVYLDVLEKYI